MSLRFRRSVRLAPGIRLNLGLRGPSLSVGPRGAGVTIGAFGLTSHVGIPGTGVSYRQTIGRSSRGAGAVPRDAIPLDACPRGQNPSGVSVQLELAEDGHLRLADTSGQPLDPRVDKKAREAQGGQLNTWLSEQCDAINAEVDHVIHLHVDTPAPHQEFHYALVTFVDPRPVEPVPLELGFLDRVLGGRRRRRETAHAELGEIYRRSVQKWEAARDAHAAEQERLRRRFEEERMSSVETMHELLAEALHKIQWPRETLVNFEIEGDGQLLQMDVDLPEIEDMPTRTAEVAARGLKLNFHALSETQVRKMYLTHVHAVLFRAIGEVFATLPGVRTLDCSGFSERADPATGHTRNDYLLSVRVTRAQWEQIDFTGLAGVDPVASLTRFELRCDSTASGVLRPIEPFEARSGTVRVGTSEGTKAEPDLPPGPA